MSFGLPSQQPQSDRRDLVGDTRVLRFDLQPAARRQRDEQFTMALIALGVLDHVGGVHALSVAQPLWRNATQKDCDRG